MPYLQCSLCLLVKRSFYAPIGWGRDGCYYVDFGFRSYVRLGSYLNHLARDHGLELSVTWPICGLDCPVSYCPYTFDMNTGADYLKKLGRHCQVAHACRLEDVVGSEQDYLDGLFHIKDLYGPLKRELDEEVKMEGVKEEDSDDGSVQF